MPEEASSAPPLTEGEAQVIHSQPLQHRAKAANTMTVRIVDPDALITATPFEIPWTACAPRPSAGR